MEDNNIIQKALDVIESRITERVTPHEVATECGYSVFHYNRIFSSVTGITLMAYITRRKLQYALYDISRGEKIIDVALKYGFETHAGFTKAFKKCFGYPPSIYRIHAICSRPTRMEVTELIIIVSGGKIMHPEITEIQPFSVVGYTSRHKMPDVRFTHDIPAYWDTAKMNYWDPLTKLQDLFNKSRHREYTICFDIDPSTGEFTYLLGVGVDNPEDIVKIQSDMFKMEMPGGLYAKFTTSLIEEAKYTRAIRDTWKTALVSWLPESKYKYDETRYDFEYYDERDHFYHQNGKDLQQMDIFIPIKKR